MILCQKVIIDTSNKIRIHLPPPNIRNPNFFPVGGGFGFLFISGIYHIESLCQQCRFDAGLLALILGSIINVGVRRWAWPLSYRKRLSIEIKSFIIKVPPFTKRKNLYAQERLYCKAAQFGRCNYHKSWKYFWGSSCLSWAATDEAPLPGLWGSHWPCTRLSDADH